MLLPPAALRYGILALALLLTLLFLLLLGSTTHTLPSTPAVLSSAWSSTTASLGVQNTNKDTLTSSFNNDEKSVSGGVGSAPARRPAPVIEAEPELRDIQNATLGFQKIFILSLPSRTDKRDALRLSARLSGLAVEFVDGVDGTTVGGRAYPQKWNMDEPPGTIGCWRGHMDIYHKMIAENVQSALIFEDDADWDIFLAAQLTEVARGMRWLQDIPHQRPTHSPYGDAWDFLSTGHCGIWNHVREDGRYWVNTNDPTVIPPAQRAWSRVPDLTPSALAGNRSRLVFNNYKFTCLASYALSLRGAERILHDQAVLPHAAPIDVGISNFCKRREYGNTSCLAVYPMLTSVHHPAGDTAGDSDRSTLKPGKVREKAVSDNLVFPVRLALSGLLKGERVVRAQWPEWALVTEADVGEVRIPRGRGVLVREGEYKHDS